MWLGLKNYCLNKLKALSFLTKMTLLFSVFFIVMGAGVSYFAYVNSIYLLKQQIEDRFQNQAFHTMFKIKMLLSDKHEELRRLADNISTIADKSEIHAINKEITKFKQGHDIDSVSYFNMQRLRLADTSGMFINERDESVKYWKDIEIGEDSAVFIGKSAQHNNKYVIYYAEVVRNPTGKKQGVIVARGLADELNKIVSDLVGIYKGRSEIKLDVLDNQGLVLYTNYEKERILKGVSPDWEDIRKTKEAGLTVGAHRHMHEGIGDELHAFALEQDFKDYKSKGWCVVVHFPAKLIFESAEKLKRQIIFFTLLMLALGIVGIYYLSLRLTHPIFKIIDGANTIANGNFDVTIPVASRDEVGQLGETFNNMAARLKHFHKTISDYSIDLESKVAERTAEINETNERLSNELEERNLVTQSLIETKTRLEIYNVEIQVLSEMTESLQNCQTVPDAYSVIAQSGNELFPDNPGIVMTYDSKLDIYKPVAGWGKHPFDSQTLENNECIALRSNIAYISNNDTHKYEAHCSFSQTLKKSHICVPFPGVNNKGGGLIHLLLNDKTDIISQRDIKTLAMNMGGRLNIALTNLMLRDALKQTAVRDQLTGLFNRHYMDEMFEQTLISAAREKTQMGIVMIDIDHFKKINDTYGHPSGDAVLKGVGEFLLSHIRGSDIICRYGGEEFLLILPKTNLISVIAKVEQLLKEIQELKIVGENVLIEHITASFGVAVYPKHGANSASLLSAADKSLYEAKKSGRNTICFARN